MDRVTLEDKSIGDVHKATEFNQMKDAINVAGTLAVAEKEIDHTDSPYSITAADINTKITIKSTAAGAVTISLDVALLTSFQSFLICKNRSIYQSKVIVSDTGTMTINNVSLEKSLSRGDPDLLLTGDTAINCDTVSAVSSGDIGIAQEAVKVTDHTTIAGDHGVGKVIILGTANTADRTFTLISTIGRVVSDTIAFINLSDHVLTIDLADGSDKINGLTTEKTLVKGQGIMWFYPSTSQTSWMSF